MKFIILAFEFRNNGRSPEETPYLSYGRIATSKWHIFPIWQGSGKRRRATEKEVSELIGSSGGYEELLPGKTTVGCVVFEIPKDEEPMRSKFQECLQSSPLVRNHLRQKKLQRKRCVPCLKVCPKDSQISNLTNFSHFSMNY